jgi:hypothetical protein
VWTIQGLSVQSSFDHLVRPNQQLRRDRQADLIRRLEVYHQLELRRLPDRQIGGLGSLQDPVHVICDAAVALAMSAP